MTRRPFLDTPEAWTRASRTSQSRAEAACAVEVHKRDAHARWDVVMVVVCAIAATLMLTGVI